MWVLLMVKLVVSVSSAAVPLANTQCERAPSHAQPADRHYRLSIAGDPDLYLSGELYMVFLNGVDGGEGPTPFTGFMIWAEMDEEQPATNQKNSSIVKSDSDIQKSQSLGTFQAYDAQTKLHEHCKPAVDNATTHPKTEIQVIWNTPSSLESCVRLCARVVHVVSQDGVEKITARSILARKLCPAPVSPAGANRQPPIVEPCCACDEAKYEVTFEGLWSRHTHPREFPSESARAHFGDVIGASHTAQYRVWQEGRVASAGMRRLVDDGTTTAIEKELKEESDHIRTIIKARGISWQQVSGAGIPTTFAVFRVDARNHLVSLAAKLAPSPDWFVGVSALELCNANCTWRRSATLPLYPYDAGTDSGISYTSRRQATSPPAAVRALRPDWPRDPRSPFYNAEGEIRPFARLRLTRLRLYEKSCDTSVFEFADPEATAEYIPETGGGTCATHSWGAWSPCSVSCGVGRASRQRHYVWPARAFADGCRVLLTDYRRCHGPRMHCRVISDYEPDPAETSGPCAVSQWGEWSPCEGCGVRARTRHYLVPRAHKRCHVGFRARTVLSQAMPCDAGPCYKPTGELENATTFDWFFVDNPRGECPVTSWGGWSPCSARCGRGRRIRTRLYIARDSRIQHPLTRRLLHIWNQRFAEIQQLDLPVVNMTDEDPDVENAIQEHMERCQFTLTQQEALCDGDGAGCLGITNAKDACMQPMSVGPCRGYEERWFFDTSRGICEPFGFTGCGGNANNFRTRELCESVCQTITETASSRVEITTKKFKVTPSSEDNEVMQNDEKAVTDTDCETGPWLGWSECFGECDYAIKLNYRLIVQAASGTGKSCPKIIKSRHCRPGHCRKLFAEDSTPDFDDTLNEKI